MKKLLMVFLILFIFSLAGCQKSGSIDEENLFSSGLLAVKMDGKWGYVDKSGKVIIQTLYDGAHPFINDNAIVEINGKFQIINKKGDNVLDRTYDDLHLDYETGNIFYYVNNRWGMMNSKGKVLTDALYDSFNAFNNDRAMVKAGSKYGFIDKSGEIVISLIYDYALNFSNGLAAVKQDEKYGYIDTSGEVVIDFFYDTAKSFDSYGNAIVTIETETDSKYSLINKKNVKIIDSVIYIFGYGPLYEADIEGDTYIYTYDGTKFNNHSYYRVYSLFGYAGNVEDHDENDMYILFNEDGTVFKSHNYYESQLELYMINGSATYVLASQDDDFLDIHTYETSYRLKADSLVQMLSNERFIIERSEKQGIVDKNGDIIVEFLYDALFYTNDGFLIFMINDKIGFMDSKFKTIVTATYESINPF